MMTHFFVVAFLTIDMLKEFVNGHLGENVHSRKEGSVDHENP